MTLSALPRGVVMLFDAKALSGDRAAQDVRAQMDAVEEALSDDAVAIARLPVTMDLRALRTRMNEFRPDCVVNLVESLDNADRLQTIVPMLLEEWGIPFTGCGSLGMHLSNDKIAAKRTLLAYGLPTPDCAWLENGRLVSLRPGTTGFSTWIIKTRESHASLFVNDASVFSVDAMAALESALREAEAVHGQSFFAERFVDGREFNLSILPDASGNPMVLPAAEISFHGLPEGKPRIVGYDAKWSEESAEYVGTERVFPGDVDAALLSRLERLALSTWGAFGLSGYARVDFRVDEAGEAFILEANANPCISPDAGFSAAAFQAGLSYRDMIVRILLQAVER